MRWEMVRGRLLWSAAVTTILASGAWAQAQQDGPQAEEVIRKHKAGLGLFAEETEEARRYYIGLECYQVDPALRAQLKLPENQGLLVESVVAGGPGEKAGIRPYDVLLKSGDRPLGEVSDLADEIAKHGDKPLALSILRGGATEVIEVAPAPRAETALPTDPAARWLQRARQALPQIADRLDRDVLMFRPGMPVRIELPEDLSLTVEKQGQKPAKVTVRKGDQSWEVTDDSLDKLPDEVRGYVELYLGRMPTLPLPPELAQPLTIAVGPPGEGAPAGTPRERRIGPARRLHDEAAPVLDALNERLERIERELRDRLKEAEEHIEQLRGELEKKSST